MKILKNISTLLPFLALYACGLALVYLVSPEKYVEANIAGYLAAMTVALIGRIWTLRDDTRDQNAENTLTDTEKNLPSSLQPLGTGLIIVSLIYLIVFGFAPNSQMNRWWSPSLFVGVFLAGCILKVVTRSIQR